jgi:hypothetical protein
MPRRKKSTQPQIEPEEIERLKALIEKEEELELQMKQDLREAVRGRDKKLIRELHRLENKNRRLVMWIGVIVLMLAVVAFWVSRLDVIIARPLTSADTSQNIDLSEVQANLQNTVQQVIKSIDEMKQQAAQLNAASTSSAPAVNVPINNNNARLP